MKNSIRRRKKRERAEKDRKRLTRSRQRQAVVIDVIMEVDKPICPYCSGEQLIQVGESWFDGELWQVVTCKDCGEGFEVVWDGHGTEVPLDRLNAL